MSVFVTKTIEGNGQLVIWKIEESEHFFKSQLALSVQQSQELDKKHQKRRLEWLASRHLIQKMSQGVPYEVDEYGKPYFPNLPLHLSISHSGKFAAVATHHQSLGIDIQKITPKINRIAHKFLRAEEKECLSETHSLEHIHVFWGAKEALYKAYGKKELDFRAHIFIEPFSFSKAGDNIQGSVQKGDYRADFNIRYELFDDYMLVYGIEKLA